MRRLALTALAVLALGACSGDDSGATATGSTGSTETTTGGPAPGEGEYLAAADEICGTGFADLAEVYQQEIPDPDAAAPGEIRAFIVEIGVPATQVVIDDLRALTPPAEIEAQVTAWLDEFQAANDALESDPPDDYDGPNPYADAGTLAAGLGLELCSQS